MYIPQMPLFVPPVVGLLKKPTCPECKQEEDKKEVCKQCNYEYPVPDLSFPLSFPYWIVSLALSFAIFFGLFYILDILNEIEAWWAFPLILISWFSCPILILCSWTVLSVEKK